jgi:hypothetical protein
MAASLASPTSTTRASGVGDESAAATPLGAGAAAAAAAASTGTPERVGPLDFTRAKYDAMCAALKVARWHDTQHSLKTISGVMSGEELTAWFIGNSYVTNAAEAEAIGNFLLTQRVLFPMLRRLASENFKNSAELFYMQQPEREEKSVVADAFSKVKALVASGGTSAGRTFGGGGVAGGGAGSSNAWASPFSKERVRFVAEGYVVHAIIYEHERYGGNITDGMSFAAAHLLDKEDPQPYSLPPAEVPIPSVGNASADLCEWIDEWAPIVTEGKTSGEGWVYGESFQTLHQLSQAKFNVHDHRVRARAWQRSARRTPEVVHMAVVEEAPETKKEVEDRAHREMLERVEAAKRMHSTRFLFQWSVSLVALASGVAPSSLFVVVEHFATRLRSNAAASRASSQPGKVDFPIGECSGQFEVSPAQVVGFAVWANLALGRKQQLGYASFCVPNTATAGDVAEEHVEVTDKENRSLGSLSFDWTMAPAPPSPDDALAPPGEEGGTVRRRNSSAALHTPRCVLELSVVQISRVDSRVLERSRGSRMRCLATFLPGGEPKAFLRVRYRGLVSQMTLESPRVLLTETTRFDFSTFLTVRHLVPVVVEVWYERGTPGSMTQEMLGDVRLDFVRSGIEMSSNEKPVVAAPDLATGIYRAAIDALPPEAKPAAPPPVANPGLEELIKQQRRAKAAAAATTGGADAPGDQLMQQQQQQQQGGEAALLLPGAAQNGQSIYGALGADLPPLNIPGLPALNAPGATTTAAAAAPTAPTMPQMLATTCLMMLRYKYVVEGESDGGVADLERLVDVSAVVSGSGTPAVGSSTSALRPPSAAMTPVPTTRRLEPPSAAAAAS